MTTTPQRMGDLFPQVMEAIRGAREVHRRPSHEYKFRVGDEVLIDGHTRGVVTALNDYDRDFPYEVTIRARSEAMTDIADDIAEARLTRAS